jgi:prefoldin subunit 2
VASLLRYGPIAPRVAFLTPFPSSLSTHIYSAQQIVQDYNNMRSKIQDMTAKINELDTERNEHALVIRALEPLDGNKRCYRSIGGVLVERKVSEVLPLVS